jgi:restriction system protein
LYDLFRAGLLGRPKRGIYVITETGNEVAAQKPKVIDRDLLMRFPQFANFAHSVGTRKPLPAGADSQVLDPGGDAATKEKTPEELIGTAYQVLHSALKKGLQPQKLNHKWPRQRFELASKTGHD